MSTTGVESNPMADARTKKYLPYSSNKDSMFQTNHGHPRHYRPPYRVPYYYQPPPRDNYSRVNDYSQHNFSYSSQRFRSDNMPYYRPPVYYTGPRYPRYTVRDRWDRNSPSSYRYDDSTKVMNSAKSSQMVQPSKPQTSMTQSKGEQVSNAQPRVPQLSMAQPCQPQISTVQSNIEQSSMIQPKIIQHTIVQPETSQPEAIITQTRITQPPKMPQSSREQPSQLQASMGQQVRMTQPSIAQPRVADISTAQPRIEQTSTIQTRMTPMHEPQSSMASMPCSVTHTLPSMFQHLNPMIQSYTSLTQPPLPKMTHTSQTRLPKTSMVQPQISMSQPRPEEALILQPVRGQTSFAQSRIDKTSMTQPNLITQTPIAHCNTSTMLWEQNEIGGFLMPRPRMTQPSSLAQSSIAQTSMMQPRIESSMALPHSSIAPPTIAQTSKLPCTSQFSIAYPGMTKTSGEQSRMSQTKTSAEQSRMSQTKQPGLAQSPIAQPTVEQATKTQTSTALTKKEQTSVSQYQRPSSPYSRKTSQPSTSPTKHLNKSMSQSRMETTSMPQPNMKRTLMPMVQLTKISMSQPRVEQASMIKAKMASSTSMAKTSMSQSTKAKYSPAQSYKATAKSTHGSERPLVQYPVSSPYSKEWKTNCTAATTTINDEYSNKVVSVSKCNSDVQRYKPYPNITNSEAKFKNRWDSTDKNMGKFLQRERKKVKVSDKEGNQSSYDKSSKKSTCLSTEMFSNSQVGNNHYKASHCSDKKVESDNYKNEIDPSETDDDASSNADVVDVDDNKDADELLMSMSNRSIKISRLLEEQKRLMATLHVVKHKSLTKHNNTSGYTW